MGMSRFNVWRLILREQEVGLLVSFCFAELLLVPHPVRNEAWKRKTGSLLSQILASGFLALFSGFTLDPGTGNTL